jgi:phospholipase/lecithinase/hemolysin
MDNDAIPIPTTTTSTAPALPTRMHTVVVFGDSLCDIGKKWKSTTGALAKWTHAMYVSPTGRYSDCRNWTDFMVEAAGGKSMVALTPEETITKSVGFTSLKKGNVLSSDSSSSQPFLYANYAEGGACGDAPPGTWSAVLGKFETQVDEFEKDCKALPQRGLGNTLFIIWFGLNDIYTANRKAEEMPAVAQVVADKQRTRLAQIVENHNRSIHGVGGTCKFIFVDLCRPLASVRYTKRLQIVETNLKTLLGHHLYHDKLRPLLPPSGTFDRAFHTLKVGMMAPMYYTLDIDKKTLQEAVVALHDQIVEIENLESGVTMFNATLKQLADQHGDRVVEVGKCFSEQTILKLVSSHKYRLKAGAMATEVEKYISALTYDLSGSVQHIFTVDEVHPTDQMYKLIWLEVYEQIKRSNCTFGSLPSVVSNALTPLAELSMHL